MIGGPSRVLTSVEAGLRVAIPIIMGELDGLGSQQRQRDERRRLPRESRGEARVGRRRPASERTHSGSS